MTGTTHVQENHRELLIEAYAAYNRQDVEALLALVGDEVDWPGDDGSRLHGRAELRTYWTEQWARTRTWDEPVSFEDLVDGRTAVYIVQVVRTLDGSIVSQGDVRHIHRFDGCRLLRMDIEAHPELSAAVR